MHCDAEQLANTHRQHARRLQRADEECAHVRAPTVRRGPEPDADCAPCLTRPPLLSAPRAVCHTQVISQEEQWARSAFYERHNIAFVARPPLGRRGVFKKASNLNYQLAVSDRVAELVGASGLNPQQALLKVLDVRDSGQEFGGSNSAAGWLVGHALCGGTDTGRQLPGRPQFRTVCLLQAAHGLGAAQVCDSLLCCLSAGVGGA